MNPQDILAFWFEEITSKQWFAVDPGFDAEIRERFAETHQRAACGELDSWRESAAGRLAEIIVLDQFSRNMFRGSAQAFAYDPLALVLAQEALRADALAALDKRQKPFLLMPYMHSESAAIHAQAMVLFQQPGMEGNLDFERRHKAIIDRFGRYPHRNDILGRPSTAEEIAFLQEPGSSF